MAEFRKKFTVEMRRDLISKSIARIEFGGGMTQHKHFVLDTEASFTMGCDVKLDADSIMNMTGSLRDQQIVKAWRYRRNESVNLAVRMGFIKSEQYVTEIEGARGVVSRYVATKRGKKFRLQPKFIQWTWIAVPLAYQRVVKMATRFKIVLTVVGLGSTMFRIWQSGAVSVAWVAASAAVAVVIASIACLLGGQGGD
ncbi:hypothetical protein [Stenotrophomonas sp. 59]|uniref:hypothetical protein n=1 Tax=Stenotrophomonas sp. 59 TaxID=3051120 RepID=UPI00256F3A05|nr:hypothetical protein [Stenotrophomonas sp. 59]